MDSPNVLNYFIGKGVISFMRDGEAEYRDMGNAPTVEFTPDVTTLDHFSSRTGRRTKDMTVVTEASGTLHLVLDEVTAQNLALQLLGDIETSSEGHPRVRILSRNVIGGAFKLVGTNDIGQKVLVEIPRVEFVPNSTFGFITDEWGQIDITGNVVAVSGDFGSVTFIDETVSEPSSETESE